MSLGSNTLPAWLLWCKCTPIRPPHMTPEKVHPECRYHGKDSPHD